MKVCIVSAALLLPVAVFAQQEKNAITDTVQKDKPVLLDEVVVTGSKIAVAKNYVPLNITVINRQQIENSSESALLPVLAENVPGLFVTERGVAGFGVSTGAAGSITMRGLSGSPNSRVLVLINGVPQFMGIFGHPLPDAYVASDVEKVEVLHGAGSVLYGSNAMGGVVNIITRSQQQEGYAVNARLLYGSFNTQKYMVNAGWRKKKLSMMVSFNHDRTDGHRASSDFKISNGYFKIGYNFSRHFVVSAETNIATYIATDPGMENGPVGNTIDIFRGSSYVNLVNSYEKTSGSLQLFYNYGDHSITDGFRSVDGNYGLALSQSFRHINNNITTIGFDYKKYGGKARNIFALNGQGILFGDHQVTSYAPYVLTQQTIAAKLMVSAGIRLEHHSVFGDVLIPSGGISFLADKATTIKAAVSKGFRSPTILDLYLFPPANPLLDPEKMMDYEITVNHQSANKKVKLELTVFNVQGDNLIQTVFQNGGPKNVNTGRFNNTGAELSAQYFISQHFSAMLTYGYTDLKYPVTAAPRHLLNAGINYTQQKLSLHVGMQAVNGLYTRTGAFPMESNYIVLNAKAGYTISRLWDIFIKGENLSDQRYEVNNGYPMPGITVMAGLHFHLSKK